MSGQGKQKRTYTDLTILGVNLLIFAIYTGLGLQGNSDGLITSFFIAVFHFVICCIMAIAVRRWSWFLAGVLIIIIGLGTCANSVKI